MHKTQTIKKIFKYFVLGLIVYGLFAYFFPKFNVLRLFDSNLKIDETQLIVDKIKAENKMYLYAVYTEKVMDSSYNSQAITLKKPKLVLIIKGTTKSYIQLNTLTKDNVILKNDSLILKLKNPFNLETTINPSDIEVFEQTGYWGASAIGDLANKAKYSFEDEAQKLNIIENSKVSLQRFLARITNKKIGIEIIN